MHSLTGHDKVEEIHTFVGDWATIHIEGIGRLVGRDDTRVIDILAAYRVGEIRRVLDRCRSIHCKVLITPPAHAARLRVHELLPSEMRAPDLLERAPRAPNVSGQCKAFFPPVERRERRETATVRWPVSFYL